MILTCENVQYFIKTTSTWKQQLLIRTKSKWIWGMSKNFMILFAWERHHASIAPCSVHCALNCVTQRTIQDALTMFSGDDSADDADSELILLPRQTCQIIKTTWIALLHVYSSKCVSIILIKMTPSIEPGEWKVGDQSKLEFYQRSTLQIKTLPQILAATFF